MSAARQKAFTKLKKQVDKYRGELGNIHEIMEDYLQNVKRFPKTHDIHNKVAQLETIAGLILQEAEEADKLLKKIKKDLSDHKKTKKKVKELLDLLEKGPTQVAGAQALEKDINDHLGR